MRHHMIKITVIFLAVLFSAQAFAEDAALARPFSTRGLEGTIVISSLNGEKTFIHNDGRANKRFSPASTFKVLNTLIALEEKAVRGKTELLKWDGTPKEFPDWNRDHTLESAFKVSCVWCYQELARRVGAKKYTEYLKKSNYGELSVPFDETNFWLDGSLVISAVEQTAFLKNVYLHTLPFSRASYETLRDIMLIEQTPAYTIRAKTGWSRLRPETAWYVGYVETQDDTWVFAINYAVRNSKDLAARQQLMREAFQGKVIIK
jgi:beta-lactamase class D